MSLGSEKPRRRIYYLNPKSIKLINGAKIVDPHFVVKLVDETGQHSDLPNEKQVSGNLLSIGHGEYEYPKDSGKKVKTIHLYLIDNNCLYKIEGSVNTNMMRGLMNTVAGTKTFEYMEISLYEKGGFPNLFVRNNNNKCEWKYDYKEDIAPLITTAPDPQDEEKVIKIYHAVNKLLWEAWLETEPIVAAHALKMGYDTPFKPTTQGRPAAETHSLQEELDKIEHHHVVNDEKQPHAVLTEDDDLPF